LIDQLVATASTAFATIVNDAGDLLYRPLREVSDLPAFNHSAHSIPVVYGDVAQAFVVVRRIGLSVEIIPHMMGDSGRPLGVRGIWGMWRVSSKVVNPAVNLLRSA
jgi:HK97 family phage major capsid protein